jgi:hypothetical protein
MSVDLSPDRSKRTGYRRPVLAVYGAVHDRTLSNPTSNAMNDKQSSSDTKT